MVHLSQRLFFILFILLGLPLTLLVNSCSDNTNGDPDEQTLQFWHFYSEPTQRKTLDSIVAEFTKQTGVSVELTALSWADGKQKLQAAFSSGTAPDVLELGSDWVAQFSSAGVLMELPHDSASIGRFIPFAMEPSYWQKKLYAYPWSVDTRVLYLNRDILAKAGWKGPITTYAQLQEACEMAVAAGYYGFGANGADGHRLYKKILPVMWTFQKEMEGAEAMGLVGEKGNIRLATAANEKALNQYASLARTGIIETQRQLDAAFLQGKIAAWNSGSWLLPRIAESKLNIEAVLMPGISSTPGVSFAGGEYLAVNQATKNTQRAREFVEFLTSAEQSLKLCKSIPEAGFPADKTVFQSPQLTNNKYRAVFAQQLEHARMTPVHKNWLDIEAVIENATVKVLLAEEKTSDVLKAAQEEVDIITRSRTKR